MLKSLFKKKEAGPTAEEILALSASRAALVGRMDGILTRAAATTTYTPPARPVFQNPLEQAA